MKGLLRVRVPLLARRGLTLAPALLVLASGIDPTWALVLSQVLLSLGIPFAVIPLVILTSQRRLMGRFANTALLRVVAWAAVVAIVVLNLVLIALTVSGG